MATAKQYRVVMCGEEPAVIQHEINDFLISWNPDDNRFYVYKDDDTKATFAELRNAVQYCKTH